MDRGGCLTTVHGVTKSWTRLKQLSKHARMHIQVMAQSKFLWLRFSRIEAKIFVTFFPELFLG